MTTDDSSGDIRVPRIGWWRQRLLAWSKLAVLRTLHIYSRYVSPLFLPSCRFYPSCSRYAGLAITRHGLVRGGILALKRVLRCHPLHPGGVDPVPGDP